MIRKRCVLLCFLPLLFSCKRQADIGYYSYVDGLDQIGASAFREEGLSGRGVKIGVIDLGFANLNTSSTTRHLADSNRICFTRQYYTDSLPGFFDHAEQHGYLVTFLMGGRSKRDSVFGGALAIRADYYLAKIGKSTFESKSFPGEEAHIGKALEDFRQRGVRLVNIALGFWDEFEDEEMNYSPAQMDGKTSRIAKICREYAAKGMIIVTAAGNTGEYAWRTVWTPADVKEVITVGAVSHKNLPFRASYSGIGNPSADFVKPDVVCYSSWGTSVSTPVITSLVAGMLERDSTLSFEQIRDILHKASSLYPYPNNYVGYGIPDASRILRLIDDPGYVPEGAKEVHLTGDEFSIPDHIGEAVLFQKTGPYVVKRQYLLKSSGGKITVKRKKGIPRSTIAVANGQTYELFWR